MHCLLKHYDVTPPWKLQNFNCHNSNITHPAWVEENFNHYCVTLLPITDSFLIRWIWCWKKGNLLPWTQWNVWRLYSRRGWRWWRAVIPKTYFPEQSRCHSVRGMSEAVYVPLLSFEHTRQSKDKQNQMCPWIKSLKTNSLSCVYGISGITFYTVTMMFTNSGTSLCSKI